MRQDDELMFIIGDHLGSTSLVTDDEGNVISETKYKAWGETRYSSGTEMTKYQYTGQYSYASDFGLHFYNARWYDSSLSRFAQADTIIPQSQGVQAWDRYAHVNNSPVNYVDPTGHVCSDPDDPTPSCDGSMLQKTKVGNQMIQGGTMTGAKVNGKKEGGGNNLPSDIPQIGPTPSIPNNQRNIVTEIETFWYIMHDLLYEPLIQVSNIGKPLYKQVKGFIPFGWFGEFILGTTFQALDDLRHPDLSLSQRLLRAGTVGAQDAFTDVVSSGAGTLAGVATGMILLGDIVPLDKVPGGGIVFFVTMVSTDVALTNYFSNQNEIWFNSPPFSNP